MQLTYIFSIVCFLTFYPHLQRSISFRTEARPLPPMPIRSRQKASSYPRRRSSQLWSDTVDSMSQELSTKEIKRQEVNFNLHALKIIFWLLLIVKRHNYFKVLKCWLKVLCTFFKELSAPQLCLHYLSCETGSELAYEAMFSISVFEFPPYLYHIIQAVEVC